ncbi:MAG: redoxin domain-containing protein [Tangfeifania sp.]
MMKHIGILFLLFCSVAASSQGLDIEVKLDQAAGKKVFLANYYLGNIYTKDTIQLDSEGMGVFKTDSLLPQGLYKIYMDKDHHFDFLLGADQQFSLSNPSFAAAEMNVEGSDETEAFVDYIVFLKNLQDRGAELRENIKSAPEVEKEQLRSEMEGLTDRLHQKWETIEDEHPDWFLAKFVKANHVPALDVSILPEEVQKNDSLLRRKQFNYQREHFWDNFDYTDERFLYTPFYKPKLETWFTKVLYQNYDSIKPYVFSFIEDVRPNKRLFQFVTSWFLNSSVNSNIMGMDALFVDLAREYYLSGDAFWATEKTLENIRENVLFAKDNLIGKTAPNLTLESFDGEYFTLHDVEADYTVLVIYEPDCSHCKVFVPELYEKVYEKFRDKGLEAYAIYSMDNKEEWGEFLTKYGLFDWINVWDEHHVSRFKILYDARKTPGVYILDENKKIVAKKMTIKQLEKFFEMNLNQ